MAKPAFRAPKGTRDILWPESARQRVLVDRFAETASAAGFGQLISPIFEELEVFRRLGESTEVVQKEMFDFCDKGDPPQRLALRPELTASACRAFAEHRPVVPWKIWYEGPQFRYEQPQAGRYRQFSQVGVELLGSDDPAADVDVIAAGWRFLASLGLRRVTDSKRAEDQAVIAAAPVMADFLGAEAAEHFAAVRAGLDLLGIGYVISPRLVRGLDYYGRTAFEYAGEALSGAQDALGGGGRYDGLVEALGGPPTPGVGFALGVDRILLACDAEETFASPPAALSVFVVDVTGGSEALALCDLLRSAGISADRAYGGRSMKAQMKLADRSGARFAAIIGVDEAAAGEVSLRDLRPAGRDRPPFAAGAHPLLPGEAGAGRRRPDSGMPGSQRPQQRVPYGALAGVVSAALSYAVPPESASPESGPS